MRIDEILLENPQDPVFNKHLADYISGSHDNEIPASWVQSVLQLSAPAPRELYRMQVVKATSELQVGQTVQITPKPIISASATKAGALAATISHHVDMHRSTPGSVSVMLKLTNFKCCVSYQQIYEWFNANKNTKFDFYNPFNPPGVKDNVPLGNWLDMIEDEKEYLLRGGNLVGEIIKIYDQDAIAQKARWL